MRTVVNMLADGSIIALADPNGWFTEWQLSYNALSDQEAQNLESFFTTTEGSLNTFTFLDPTGNLLAWSDHLDHNSWSVEPYLSVSGELGDPVGGTNGWHITNSGAAPQRISQTLAAPGDYLYCISLYVRASQVVTVTLVIGSKQSERVIGTQWQRIIFADKGDAEAQSVEFGLELPADAEVDVFGFQVEAQATASVYKSSTTGGVYENARFRDNVLSIVATDVNRHSTTVVIHANS